MSEIESLMHGGGTANAKNVFRAMANPEFFREESATVGGGFSSVYGGGGRKKKEDEELIQEVDEEEYEFRERKENNFEDVDFREPIVPSSPSSPPHLSRERFEMKNSAGGGESTNKSTASRWLDIKFRIRRLNKKMKKAKRPESDWMKMPDPARDNLEDVEELLKYEEREMRQEAFVLQGKVKIIMFGNCVEKGALQLQKWGINIPVNDWTESTLIPSMDQFDDALERLHDQLDGKIDMPPAAEILMIFVMSAMSHAMMQLALNNTQVQNAINAHMSKPEVAERIAENIVQTYKKTHEVPLPENSSTGDEDDIRPVPWGGAAGGGRNSNDFLETVLGNFDASSMLKSIVQESEQAKATDITSSPAAAVNVTANTPTEEPKKKRATTRKPRRKNDAAAASETSYTFEM